MHVLLSKILLILLIVSSGITGWLAQVDNFLPNSIIVLAFDWK